jgi:hypothetical protein
MAPISTPTTTVTAAATTAATVTTSVAAASPLFAGRFWWLASQFSENHLAGKLHAVVFIDCDDANLKDITDLAYFINTLDVTVVEFGDVAKAITTGGDLHKRAEFLDRGDFAFVGLANLDLFGDGFDATTRGFGPGGFDVADIDSSIVLNIDFGASALLDTLDVLATGPDEHTDLLGIDLNGKQPWRVSGNFFARLTQHTQHLLEDVTTTQAGLL